VLLAVRRGLETIPAMVARLYRDVPVELHKPAARSVLAHLVSLCQDGSVVTADGGRPGARSTYLPV
jgi:hypothetical protein